MGVFAFFEASAPRTQDRRLVLPAHGYLALPHAFVIGRKVAPAHNATDEHACAASCDEAPGCAAYAFSAAQPRACHRLATVTALHASPKWSASLRRGASWPRPLRLRWESNATLLLAWTGEPIVPWLLALPASLDFAVVAVALAAHNDSAAAPRRPRPRREALLALGRRLKYYAELPYTPAAPNFAPGTAGASRASRALSALAALHFIDAAFEMLPPLILVADEACARSRAACTWQRALGTSERAARATIAHALDAATPPTAQPTEAACLCSLTRRASSHEAAGAQETGAPAPVVRLSPRALRWFAAQFAPMPAWRRRRQGGGGGGGISGGGGVALAASRVRSRPRSVYRSLLQLLMVDGRHAEMSAHGWALVLADRWVDVVFAAPAVRTPSDACFAGATMCDTGTARGSLHHRLRARSAELAARSAAWLRAMRSSMPQVAVPEMPERVRGWLRNARRRAPAITLDRPPVEARGGV